MITNGAGIAIRSRWNGSQVEHDFKNRKVFRWAQHDDSTHWPNASGHLEELKTQIRESGSKITLDLEEVNLVDVDVIRFLGTCQGEGVCLLHCSPYISDWIAKEQGREK